MNAGQHSGNTKLILDNLKWDSISFNQDLVKYFQVLNWIPDYVSLIDIVGNLSYFGFIDYIPIYLPFLGKPSFNFFSMRKMIFNFSKNTPISLEEKIYHKFHFDSLNSYDMIKKHWKWLEEQVNIWIEKIEKEEDENIQQHMLISLMAESLHAVQDFYSHTNWIELIHQNCSVYQKEDFPTWFDIFVENDNHFSDIKKVIVKLISDPNKLYSGYFPIGKDEKKFIHYHNDKGKKPGLNKDRSERPFFDVVYYLAYKNGLQWINYIKNKYFNEFHIKLLNNPLSDEIIRKVTKMQPYVKTIAFKLREWNGQGPFSNLALDLTQPILKNNNLSFKVKVSTSERLVKYDRDFRKSYFTIIIKSADDVLYELQKFGKKSGISKITLNLNGVLKNNYDPTLSLRVEYGLLATEKLIIKEY